MAGKRPHGDWGEESSAHTRQRFLTDSEDSKNGQSIKEILKYIVREEISASGDSDNAPSVEGLTKKFLPLFQEVVREQNSQFRRPSRCSIESSGSRTLQLHIDCELPDTIFTGKSILSKDGKPVKIVLRDSGSKNIITSGFLSSEKVNVVVLHGDFRPDDPNNWTKREFENKIVQNREGKGPLVTGELTVQLKEGVGYIGEVIFTDNSSWTPSQKFRLGVEVVANYNIREGVSTDVRVKERKANQKHYPPSLDDELWRLEKIGKVTGANRLSQNGISTVKDFLISYVRDPSSLRSLLKNELNIGDLQWTALITHAKTCKDYDKLFPSIGADNVNYPSSSTQNPNFPVQRDMQMNLAHPTTSLAGPLHNYEGEQECSLIQGFNSLASGANYACPSIEDPNAASTDQADEFFSGFNQPFDDTIWPNPVFRYP